MDSPGSRPAEGHRWRRRRTDWYYIAGRGAHGSQFIRASRTNCQPAESRGMTGKGANPQEQIPCPQCGRHVQRRNMKKHQRSQHDGVRRRRHACPFCLPGVHKTYSTFQDWKNHLHTTHGQCLGDDDPLDREEYAAGFKLDRWERFHHIEGDEDDRAYQRIATLRKHYGPYQGGVKGEPPGAPSTIRIPHTKGTTPDREVVPAESEFAGSDQDGSDQEEGEITQTEGEGSGTFTQMRPRDSDSGSDETTPGRESWRSARGQELVVLSTPRPRGRGKRRPERREGAAKRPRVESSSSDRRDGSEESRSGGGRDRPGRGSQRAARPSTPPRRPIPASVSPRRSPRLTKSAVQDLRSLPLTTKGGRRTAHSRSVSGDERGQGPRRSSLSSSDHGRSSRGRRSQSREPTPPQLRGFDVGDFTVVSHTTDSFTFASQHHFFPGWVRVVSAHSADRVRSVPCEHDAEEERRVKQKVRRGVEPPEVRRFLRQELLTKVGHSWWNRPRVYRYDRDEEREPMQSLRSVVVVPQGQEQQELSPAVPGGRTTLLGPVASPVTSLPHTPGRDIVVIGSSEESRGRGRDGWQRRHWNRRWGGAAWRKPYDPSGSEQSPRRRQQGEPSRGKWWPRPATPSSRKGTPPPHLCGPRATGALQRTSRWKRRERPESWQNLLPRSGSWHRRPHRRGTDPPEERSGSRSRPCSAPAPSSGRSRHHPCAAACPRPRHQRVMRTTSQAGRKIRRAVGRDLQGRWRTIRKRRGPIRRKRQGRSHRQHNWSWPSLMDWTFRPSRRSVICLRGPGPRFTSRGRRSGWSGPPRSGDEGRPRPWRSSWVDEGVNITRAGTAPCDNDQSAASMPLTSQRTEECGPPVCTIVRSVGC